MTGTGAISRALEALDRGETTEAKAILRILQSVEVAPSMGVEAYAEYLETFSKEELAFEAACARAQARLALQRLAHLRAEAEMVRVLSEDRPTLPSPDGEQTRELETVPSPAPPPPSEPSDG